MTAPFLANGEARVGRFPPWAWPLVPIAVSGFFVSALTWFRLRGAVAVDDDGLFARLVVAIYDRIGFEPLFMMAVLVLAWSSIAFLTGRIDRPWIRLARIGALGLCLSILVSLRVDGTVPASAGTVGAFFAVRLSAVLGTTLSILLVALASLASLALATDFFFYRQFEGLARGVAGEVVSAKPRSSGGVETEAVAELESLRLEAPEPDADDELSDTIVIDDEELARAVDEVVTEFEERGRDRRWRRRYDDEEEEEDADDEPAAAADAGALAADDDAADDVVDEGGEDAEEAYAGEDAHAEEDEDPDEPAAADADDALAEDEDVFEDADVFEDERADDEEIDDEVYAEDAEEAEEDPAEGAEILAASDPDDAEIDDDRHDDAVVAADEADLEDDDDAGYAEVDADDDVDAGYAEVDADDEVDAIDADAVDEPMVDEPTVAAIDDAAAEGDASWLVPRPSGQKSLFATGASDQELVTEAEALVLEYRRASVNFLKRRLRVSHDEAVDLLGELARRGVVECEAGATSGRVIDRGA